MITIIATEWEGEGLTALNKHLTENGIDIQIKVQAEYRYRWKLKYIEHYF